MTPDFDYISLTLQGIASAVTLWALWQTGNKKLLGPALSLLSDVAFVTLNIYQHLWALVPFCGVLVVIHIRNLLKWKAEADMASLTKGMNAGETVEAEDLSAAALQADHGERRSAKAYEVLAGGELR